MRLIRSAREHSPEEKVRIFRIVLRDRPQHMLCEEAVLVPTVQRVCLGAVRRALEPGAVGRARAGGVVAVSGPLQPRCV